MFVQNGQSSLRLLNRDELLSSLGKGDELDPFCCPGGAQQVDNDARSKGKDSP